MKTGWTTLAALTLAAPACSKTPPAPNPPVAAAPANGAQPARNTAGAAGTASTAGATRASDSGAAAPTPTPTLPAAVTLKAVKVVAATAVCALMNDGTVRCWGKNDRGETGIGKLESDSASPVQVPGIAGAVDLFAGGDGGATGDLTCAVMGDHSVKCWGPKGVLPDSESGDPSAGPSPIQALAGQNSVALGGGTQFFVTPAGKVMGWGSPAFNLMLTGTGGGSDKPVTELAGIDHATQVVAGMNHACALLADKTVSCWGGVSVGSMPTLVAGITDATQLYSGPDSNDTCAALSDQRVMCWAPGQPPKERAEWKGATSIAVGDQTCALLADHTVKCSGSNGSGELGDPNFKNSSRYGEAQAVPGLAGVTSVAVKSGVTCVTLESGEVQCVGSNSHGELGDGTLRDRRTFAPVKDILAATLPPAVDGADQAQQSSVPMDWSDMPAKCKHDPLNVAYPGFTSLAWEVTSAYAASQMSGKTVTVRLANYLQEPSPYGGIARGKQLMLSITFVHADLKKPAEAKLIDVGTYAFSTDRGIERRFYASTSDRKGGRMLFALSLDLTHGPAVRASGGSVTITSIDDKWVCGTLAVTASDRLSFTGPFAARIPAPAP